MFLTRPFIHSFIIELVNIFDNEWTNFDANWQMWSVRQWHEMFNFGGQEVKGQGHRRPKYMTFVNIFFAKLNQFCYKLAWVVHGAREWNDHFTGVRRSRSRSQEVEVRFERLPQASFLTSLGRPRFLVFIWGMGKHYIGPVDRQTGSINPVGRHYIGPVGHEAGSWP